MQHQSLPFPPHATVDVTPTRTAVKPTWTWLRIFQNHLKTGTTVLSLWRMICFDDSRIPLQKNPAEGSLCHHLRGMC
jgi:hypothetical protein